MFIERFLPPNLKYMCLLGCLHVWLWFCLVDADLFLSASLGHELREDPFSQILHHCFRVIRQFPFSGTVIIQTRVGYSLLVSSDHLHLVSSTVMFSQVFLYHLALIFHIFIILLPSASSVVYNFHSIILVFLLLFLFFLSSLNLVFIPFCCSFILSYFSFVSFCSCLMDIFSWFRWVNIQF